MLDMITVNTTFVVLSINVVVYTFWLIIYRLSFHPLRNFPGPKIAAATKWYEFYFDIMKRPGGTFMFEMDRMHDKYGPIVRINPDEIHVRDSAWISKLYVNPAEGARDKYPPAAWMAGTPLATFGTIDHHLHRKRRAPCVNFFSKSSVETAEPKIHAHADRLIHLIRERVKNEGFTELRRDYLAFTNDIVTQHCFTPDLPLLDSREETEKWRETTNAVATSTPIVKQFSWAAPFALSLPARVVEKFSPPTARLLHLIRRMRREADVAIAQHAQTGNDESDFKTSTRNITLFQAILNSSLPTPEKQAERIAQEGYSFIIAGSETTSHVISNATFYILANPSILHRLKNEINTSLSPNTTHPAIQQLEQLPYLSAIVKESLRISTLVTSRLPVIAPNEVLKYGEWIIPTGTPVSMSLRNVLLDPAIFPEPREFRPERWLVENKEELERMTRAWVPFSRGSRMCPGMNLALAELHIVIAQIFTRLDLKLFETTYDKDIKIVRDCFVGEPSLESQGVKVTLA